MLNEVIVALKMIMCEVVESRMPIAVPPIPSALIALTPFTVSHEIQLEAADQDSHT